MGVNVERQPPVLGKFLPEIRAFHIDHRRPLTGDNDGETDLRSLGSGRIFLRFK